MHLKSLTLKNFRNYRDETFEFFDGINALVGANAQGKTNVSEAVFYLCTGYSPKATRDKQLIFYGEDFAEIEGEAVSDYGTVKVKAVLNSSGEKTIFVNGAKLNKMGDLFGNINSVFFNPGELKLVQESPEDRRRFMNISLSQLSKRYFYALLRYNKILSQRNNLLKSYDREMVLDTLPVWDETLSQEASKIFAMRNEFLSSLAPVCEKIHAELSGGIEQLKITSENSLSGTEEEIASLNFIELKNSLDKDLKLGFTSFGPHRQDIKFTLNGVDVRHYGSQGQQRTVALALKLAEVEIFKNRTGEFPILILDDVLSELDKKRQKLLIKRLDGIQTILTATHVEKATFGQKPFIRTTIENGAIKRPKAKKATKTAQFDT